MENKRRLILTLFSELICFMITKISLMSYTNHVYSVGIGIVQFLYFLPVLMCSFYTFSSKSSNRAIFTYTTTALVLYSIILHIFNRQITRLFIDVNGIINFVEYTSKIYFICLPLVGVQILGIKKETRKNSYFLFVFRIVLLFLITITFKNLFELKGVLYAWDLCELIYTLIFFIRYKKTGI